MIPTPKAVLFPVLLHCLSEELARRNNQRTRSGRKVRYPTIVKKSGCCLNLSPLFYCNKEADTWHIRLWVTICWALNINELEKFSDIKWSIMSQFVRGKRKIKTQVPRFNSPKIIELSSFASETNYSDIQLPYELLACLTLLGLCLLHQLYYFSP